MLRYKIPLLALVVLFVTESVKADERLLPYIEWITANSALEYNGEPLPTVTTIDYQLLEIYAHGEQAVATAERDGRTLAPVEAVYNRNTKEIYFPHGVNPWDESETLVHELVHYLQQVNGTLKECSGENEPEAYELHWQWSQEHNFESVEPNWMYVFLLKMSCRDMHPYTDDSPP